MNILITGGAGFIGSNLAYLLAEVRPQWRITVLDLLTYAGNVENIGALIAGKRLSFVRGDIGDTDFVRDLFRKGGFETMFHLAAESHVDRSIHSAAEFVRTNVLGTEILLSAARESKVRRFVHISTDEVYGSLGPTGRFVETTPLDPTSPYPASKAGSDLLALAFAKTHGLGVVVTRCTNNYGPYQFPEKFIPLFITNALEDEPLPLYGDGMNVLSWLHVRDHCEGLLLAAEQGRDGEVYNLGGVEEAELPNRTVAETILDVLGKNRSLIRPVQDRPAHDRRYAVDASKIRDALGWRPRIPFAEGLRSTIEWYRENERWWKNIKNGAYRDFYERHYEMKSK